MPKGVYERKPNSKRVRESWANNFDDCYIPEPNSGCWIWLKSSSELGYGQLFYKGRLVKAHRFSYERANGPIKSSDCVLHKCDVSSCVNPDHLFIGTLKDNAIDMARKGRQHLQKLSKSDVIAIRSDPRSLKEIADDYGIAFSNVSMIKLRRTWTHVP